MITLSRGALISALGFLSVALAGLLFGLFPAGFEPVEVVAGAVVLGELILYFIALLLTSPSLGGGRILTLSLLLALARLALSVVAAPALALGAGADGADALLRIWVGNPFGALVQAVLLLITLPFALEKIFPSWLSEDMRARLAAEEGGAPGAPAARTAASPPRATEPVYRETSPAGGVIQVFSYEELQSIFRKSVGLEGFILFTVEGLVLWKDLPIRLNLDTLIAQLQSQCDTLALSVETHGLTRARKVVVESREHALYYTRLNNNFNLVMIFSSAAMPQECWNRLAIMAKTAREFLQWKYPGLPSLRALPALAVAEEESA